MEQQFVQPTKSQNDKRQYEGLTLKNGLKLLLVSDSQAKKSACSISVGVGSFYDPDSSLGLAHFLQHMLFMGSKKFPQHNEYSSFISENSGFDNAYTSDSETNYYFQIKNSAFSSAVERITNFFTGALLKEECIEKERQAVHQEYVLWTNDDNCRKWEILRNLASAPYNRFSIGNQQTLNHPKIRDDLVDFYEKYYSANIINGVLYSNMTIKEMKQQFIKFFQQIPNKNVVLPPLQEHFTKKQTSKLVQMQSIKDQSIMQYFWVTELLRPFYKNHVTDYLTHFLGHEGRNSLLSILKKEQLANQLSAYSHHLQSQTLVCIEVKLTEKGQQQYQNVYNIIMDYISGLEASQNFYQQIKQTNLIQFEFKEKSKVASYVCQLASTMHHYRLQEVLNYSTIFDEFDGALINRIISQINPFNVIIVFSHNEEIKDGLTQKYLGAKYHILDLPVRQKILPKFESISPNKFLPVDTTLFQISQTQTTPQELRENLFYLEDSSFRVCKCGIRVDIFNTKQKSVFYDFYSSYLQLLLKQISYPAEVLQTQVTYDYDSDFLSIEVFGFNHTVCSLFRQLSAKFLELDSSPDSQTLFDLALEKITEERQNFYCEEADEIATGTLDILLVQNEQTIEDSLKVLEGYKQKSVKKQAKKFWNSSIFQWIAVGNIKKQQILALTQQFQNIYKNKQNKVQAQINPVRCLKITQDIKHEVFLTSQDLSSSCCIVYYQAGLYSEQLFYRLKLLQNHISQPFFNALRTQKQLAYYLASHVVNDRGVLAIRFILVSSTLNAYGISQEIKAFVNDFFGKLKENMGGDKLTQIKESVLTKITSPHQNLNAYFDFTVKEINQNTRYFNRKEISEVKKYLDNISLEHLQATWKSIGNKSLDVLVVSLSHQQDYKKHEVKAKSVADIKKEAVYWQDTTLERFIKKN